MKPGLRTGLNKANMKMSKNSNDNTKKANYGIILILELFQQNTVQFTKSYIQPAIIL